MIKKLCILLSLVMALSLLGACSSSDNSDNISSDISSDSNEEQIDDVDRQHISDIMCHQFCRNACHITGRDHYIKPKVHTLGGLCPDVGHQRHWPGTSEADQHNRFQNCCHLYHLLSHHNSADTGVVNR